MAAVVGAAGGNIHVNGVVEGNLDFREVDLLKKACEVKHNKNGQVISTLLTIASLVAAIWAGLAIGGFSGFLVGVAIHCFIGNYVISIYHNFRNQDYLDASNALDTPSFKQFMTRNHYDYSIETIRDIFVKYKDRMRDQV